MIKVSVIIPTFKKPQYLNRTLASLAAQKAAHPYEVIVVDDFGRDPKTVEVVRFWSKKANIKYCTPSQYGMRHGRTRVRNLGIRLSRGEILVFLDDDMIVLPNFIQEHIKSHPSSRSRNVVLGYRHHLKVSPQFLEFINPVSIIGHPDGLSQLPSVKDEREDAYKQCRGDLNKLSAPWALLYSNNFSVSRELMREAGDRFDDSFQGMWGGEDVELGYRLYKAGGRYVINRQAEGFHQWHYANWRNNIKSLKVNLLRFMDAHPGLETELYADYVDIGLHAFFKDLRKYANLNGNYPSSVWDKANVRHKLLPLLPIRKSDRVLLMGLGDGKLIKHLPLTACTDVRQRRISDVKEQYPNIDSHWRLGTRLPYEDCAFDHILINDFIKILSPYHRGMVFKEALRVAKGGVYFATASNGTLAKGNVSTEKLAQLKHWTGLSDDSAIKLHEDKSIGANLFSIVRRPNASAAASREAGRLAFVVDAEMHDHHVDNAIELLIALAKKGCKVALQLEDYSTETLVKRERFPGWSRFNSKEKAILRDALRIDLRGQNESFPRISLTGQLHYHGKRIQWARGKKVGLLSSPTVHAINEQTDAVWVPGKSSAAQFVKSGVNPSKLFTIPVGINSDLLAQIRRSDNSGRKNYRFLALGTVEKADGLDLAIEAFCELAPTLKATELEIGLLPLRTRESPASEDRQNQTARLDHRKHYERYTALASYRVSRWRKQIQKAKLDPKRVRFRLLEEGVRLWPSYFEGADCYLQPHRVDMTGQWITKAMAIGLPVIATGRYLPEHLKKEGMGYFVSSREISAADSEWSDDVVYTRWADPDISVLVKQMRSICLAKNKAAHQSQGMKTSIAENMAWDRIADLVMDSLQKMGNIERDTPTPDALSSLFSGLQEHKLINIEEEPYEGV